VRHELRPACAAYWIRLQHRPSYQQAILDHAHTTVVRGTQRIRDATALTPVRRTTLGGA
jgi:hypothetical protein